MKKTLPPFRIVLVNRATQFHRVISCEICGSTETEVTIQDHPEKYITSCVGCRNTTIDVQEQINDIMKELASHIFPTKGSQ